MMKNRELSPNQAPIITLSDLGGVLNHGYFVLGHDLSGQNVVSVVFDEYLQRHGGQMPDVVLIRKLYKGNRSKRCNWRLKTIDFDYGEDKKGVEKTVVEREYDRFLEELEEGKEMRGQMNMYRVAKDVQKNDEVEAEDAPRVPFDEL